MQLGLQLHHSGILWDAGSDFVVLGWIQESASHWLLAMLTVLWENPDWSGGTAQPM